MGALPFVGAHILGFTSLALWLDWFFDHLVFREVLPILCYICSSFKVTLRYNSECAMETHFYTGFKQAFVYVLRAHEIYQLYDFSSLKITQQFLFPSINCIIQVKMLINYRALSTQMQKMVISIFQDRVTCYKEKLHLPTPPWGVCWVFLCVSN